MRLERARPKPRRRSTEDVILFNVGDARLAIAASAVDEIRGLEGLRPFAAGYLARMDKVKHTLVREKKDRERTLFVVDANAHFRLPAGRLGRVMVLRGAAAALLVDDIDRMAQVTAVSPLPLAFTGEERRWYRGLAVIGGAVVPVVEPEAVLNKGEIAVLTAELQAREAAIAQASTA